MWEVTNVKLRELGLSEKVFEIGGIMSQIPVQWFLTRVLLYFVLHMMKRHTITYKLMLLTIFPHFKSTLVKTHYLVDLRQGRYLHFVVIFIHYSDFSYTHCIVMWAVWLMLNCSRNLLTDDAYLILRQIITQKIISLT